MRSWVIEDIKVYMLPSHAPAPFVFFAGGGAYRILHNGLVREEPPQALPEWTIPSRLGNRPCTGVRTDGETTVVRIGSDESFWFYSSIDTSSQQGVEEFNLLHFDETLLKEYGEMEEYHLAE